MEIHITALTVEFVVQIGRLVKLVIRGLDIAAVVAANLQEPAYVIIEIGKHSVAVLGVTGKVAVGIVSPIELRSPIVRPRCLPVKGIVVVTDLEAVACGVKKEQIGVMPICSGIMLCVSLSGNNFCRKQGFKERQYLLFLVLGRNVPNQPKRMIHEIKDT